MMYGARKTTCSIVGKIARVGGNWIAKLIMRAVGCCNP
jgi:hypothetical protein